MSLHEEYRFRPESSIRRRLLRGLAIQLYRHPFLALSALLAATVAGAWSASRLEVQENLRALAVSANSFQGAWDMVRLPSLQNDPAIVVVHLSGDGPAPAPAMRSRLTNLLTEAFFDPSRVAYVEPAEWVPGETAPLTYAQMLTRLRPADLAMLAQASAPGEARRAMGRAERLAAQEAKRRAGREVRSRAGDSASAQRPAIAPSPLPVPPASDDPFGLLADLAGRAAPREDSLPPGLGEVPGIVPNARTIVLRVGPLDSASALFYCVALNAFLSDTAKALLSRGDADLAGARMEFHGRHIDTARREAAFRLSLLRIGAILFVCLALLTILAFRKAEAILFVGLPPIVGLVWTYGLAATFTDSIGLLTALFPILLLALGLEFTLQIYHRFIEELYRERRYYPALGTAYMEAGRGVIVTTFMAAAVFLSLSLRKFHDLHEMALVSCVGILAMALAPLLLLPPMAAIKSRLARGKVSPVDTYDFGLNTVSAAVIATPRAVLALGLVVTVYLAFFTGQTQLNYEIGLDLGAAPADVRPAVGAHAADARRLPDPPGGESVLSILVEAPTLDQALVQNDHVYENLLNLPEDMRLSVIASVSPVLPSTATQQVVFDSLRRLDVPHLALGLRTVASERGLAPDAFSPFVVTLLGLQKHAQGAEFVALNARSAPSVVQLAQKYIFHIGGVYRIQTAVVPARGSANLLTSRLGALWREIRRGDFATENSLLCDSEALQNRRVARTIVYTMSLTVFLSILWLLVAIVPHFHGRRRDILLCLLPLVCAGIWTLGFLFQLQQAMGQPTIGLSGLLMFPLVLALAANQSIVFIQRLHDRQYASLRQVVRAGGRPGVISMLMQALGMACLVQLPLLALREMATVALIGVVFSTIGVLVFVPALVQVRQEGGIFSWPADEGE